MLGPVVDDQLMIDPNAHAVVGTGGEGVFLAVRGFDFAGPTDGVSRRGDARRERGVAFEINLFIDPLDRFSGEVLVGEVSRDQPGARRNREQSPVFE